MSSASGIIAFCLAVAAVLPMCTESANPFMFQLRSTVKNPVTYQHSVLVNQFTALPCYYENDGQQFGVSNNQTDMAWYRRLESTHSPKTFPSMSDSNGRLLIMEPVIGYSWFLCDTAFTPKLHHAKKYEQFYSEFAMGPLNIDWNNYQEFSEFNKGQFKHHLFSNELSITEIFVFMNATMRKFRTDGLFDVEELTKPLQMGLFKLTLLRIMELECRSNAEQFCEHPTVDILIPIFDNDGGVTIQGKMKLFLSNERLLKLGPDTFEKNREDAIRRNLVRWTMTSQSIDLGLLGTLNPFPLTLTLILSTKAQILSDCVGSGSYLSVQNDWQCVLCRPGYHLKNEPWVQSASEKNSICHLCPVGTYSGSWGNVECHSCPPSHTTRKVGSTRPTDCLPLSVFALESKIKELLNYFDIAEPDEYDKGAMLAAILMAPWVLFLVCLVVSLGYGHSEVQDSEKRFQLEKELGSILLKIRRNYNAILEDSMRL